MIVKTLAENRILKSPQAIEGAISVTNTVSHVNIYFVSVNYYGGSRKPREH